MAQVLRPSLRHATAQEPMMNDRTMESHTPLSANCKLSASPGIVLPAFANKYQPNPQMSFRYHCVVQRIQDRIVNNFPPRSALLVIDFDENRKIAYKTFNCGNSSAVCPSSTVGQIMSCYVNAIPHGNSPSPSIKVGIDPLAAIKDELLCHN